MTSEIKEFIQRHTNKIIPLSYDLHIAYWNSTISGEDKYYQTYEKSVAQIKKIYNNKEDFNNIQSWLSKEIEDPLVKRQLDLLHKGYLRSQGDLDFIQKIISKEVEIEKKFNKFRSRVGDKEITDNEINDIFETETDSKILKEIWEASKKQGELVAEDILKLVEMRNKRATDLGFENYYAMSLELAEQQPDEIKKTFLDLANLTDPLYNKLKSEIDKHLLEKYKISEDDLRPWHYQDLFFQKPPVTHALDLSKIYSGKDIVKISQDYYSSIGFKVDDIFKKSDLYEKKGKSQHAFCIDIDRKGDVRILMNIKNNDRWMRTILHELGHAVYDINLDKELPFLLRTTAHTLTTEAIAILFDRQYLNESFIANYAKHDKSANLSGDLKKSSQLNHIIFSRWSQVMVNFERNLYENPQQDLNRLWWDLVKKYQLIDFSRDKPDWASKIHIISSPVYYHNYMLGELLASQIHAYIVKNILKKDSIINVDYSNNKEIGDYLKKFIFKLGNKYKWDEMIKKATGEKLNPKYFAEEFC